MINYKNDINEIIAFIECSAQSCGLGTGYDKSLDAITKHTGEEYLDCRAEQLRESVKTNEHLGKALRKLDSICSGRYEKKCESCAIKKYCNTYISYVRQNHPQNLTMVDLFCGAGGLSLGFVQEGFYAALANDIEECCVDTYAHNHPETPRDHIILGDIRNVVADLENLMADEDVDIVVGGPPCQGFSMANRQRLIDDPRNYLYKNYIEVVKKLRPKFFVMENVKGMFGVAGQVKEDFQKIGYTVECKVFNAKDFGVPQNRERLIYIGNRLGIDNLKIIEEIENSAQKAKKYVLKDAIYGLRSLKALRTRNSTEIDTEESGGKIERNTDTLTNEYIDLINAGRNIPIICNHKARYNNDRDIEIYSRLFQGDRSDDPKIADIMPYANRNDIFKDKYFKLEEDKVCKTITAHMKFDCNMYIHPTQARGLTPREAARVQSYPDDYFFRGSYTKTYMQIGNSVPPLLGRAIAAVIKQYL
ncbi:MAG: Modification methylase HaeIII [Firmicutes bacterium ADurb.Bin146]|nr:MAG: Modification methylase HaeIII [Firmicutes bacterium ADurb.Bin146]